MLGGVTDHTCFPFPAPVLIKLSHREFLQEGQRQENPLYMLNEKSHWPALWDIKIHIVRGTERDHFSQCSSAAMYFFILKGNNIISQQIIQMFLIIVWWKILINMQKLQCIKLQLLIENWHWYKCIAGKGNMVCDTSSVEPQSGLLYTDVFIYTNHTPISKTL